MLRVLSSSSLVVVNVHGNVLPLQVGCGLGFVSRLLELSSKGDSSGGKAVKTRDLVVVPTDTSQLYRFLTFDVEYYPRTTSAASPLQKNWIGDG